MCVCVYVVNSVDLLTNTNTGPKERERERVKCGELRPTILQPDLALFSHHILLYNITYIEFC